MTVRDQGLLDRERQTSLRMRVRARERRNSGMAGARSAAAVRVTLLDANDNNPVFQPNNVYHFQVNADAPVGEVVGQVTPEFFSQSAYPLKNVYSDYLR